MSITNIKPIEFADDQYGIVSGNLNEENIGIMRALGFESGGGMQIDYGKKYFYIRVPAEAAATLPELRERGLLFNLYPASLMNLESAESWAAEEAYCEFLFHSTEDEGLRKIFCKELLEVQKKLIDHAKNEVESIYDESLTDNGRNCYVFLPGGDWTFVQHYDAEKADLVTVRAFYCSDSGDIDPDIDIPPPFVSAIFDCLQSEYLPKELTPLQKVQAEALEHVLIEWPESKSFDEIIQFFESEFDFSNEHEYFVKVDFDQSDGNTIANNIRSQFQSRLAFLKNLGISFDDIGKIELKNNTSKRKTIGYAYPSSEIAASAGHPNTGCYFLAIHDEHNSVSPNDVVVANAKLDDIERIAHLIKIPQGRYSLGFAPSKLDSKLIDDKNNVPSVSM